MKIVPDIRFKGFEEEWKLSELGRLFIERIENNPNAEMLSVTINDGIIKASENGRFDNSNSNKSKYKSVKKGDIAYNSMRMWQGASGVSNFEGIVSPAYTVLCPVSGVNSVFFSYLFKTIDTIKKFRLHSQGMTKDTWNLKYPALSKIAVEYPLEECQQLQVASYLQNIDLQISKLVKRIVKLRQLKSACLISMFPQQGETVPRVRFKGFDGEWNEQKAEVIFRQFIEKNRPDLPVLSATQDRGMVTRKAIGYDISHDKRNECTYKHILPGQFVIHLRSFQGGFAHSDIEGIASPAYTVFEFRDKNQHNDIFWKYIFSSKSFIKQLEKITYGIRDGRSISFDEFKDMKFIIPCVKEQHQIASYFRQLDIQISEQEKRLEKLKQIKAACLDKMFV